MNDRPFAYKRFLGSPTSDCLWLVRCWSQRISEGNFLFHYSFNLKQPRRFCPLAIIFREVTLFFVSKVQGMSLAADGNPVTSAVWRNSNVISKNERSTIVRFRPQPVTMTRQGQRERLKSCLQRAGYSCASGQFFYKQR